GGVDHHVGAAVLHRGQHLAIAGHDDVTAEHEIGPARRDPDGVDVLGPPRDPHVAVDRPALLREAGHVEHPDTLAFDMGGHAENAADGADASAADAGDDDVVGLPEWRQHRLGQITLLGRRDTGAALELGAFHRHERRTESLHTGEVLVAARLVDGALAAPFGL